MGLTGETDRARVVQATRTFVCQEQDPEAAVRTCPSCGEEWAATVPVCTCGTNLASNGRAHRRWRPSRGLLMTVLVAVAVMPGAIVLALHLLPDGAVVPGGIDVPDRGREARPDELPDRRARPHVTCEGTDVAADCMVWTFTLPRDSGLGFAMARSDDAVLVRDTQNVWLMDLATGEERWHRSDLDFGDGFGDVWIVGDRAVLSDRTSFMLLDAATGDPVATQHVDGHATSVVADNQRVFTTTIQNQEVVITAWDPADAGILWQTTIETDGPAYDTFLLLPDLDLLLPDDHLVVSIVPEQPAATQDHPTQAHPFLALDRETGRELEEFVDSDPTAIFRPGRFADTRVILDGARLRGQDQAGGTFWERTLPSPFVHVQLLHGDRVALIPQDFSRITIVEADTGTDLFHVRGNGSRLQDLPYRSPWVISVRTVDAQHIVLLDLPSP